METPEKLINFAWMGGEICMRDKVINELNHNQWLPLDTRKFVIELVKSIELTKVEK